MERILHAVVFAFHVALVCAGDAFVVVGEGRTADIAVDAGDWPGVRRAANDLAHVMIDPEVVVERIVVQPDDSVYSYFGPPERRRKQ